MRAMREPSGAESGAAGLTRRGVGDVYLTCRGVKMGIPVNNSLDRGQGTLAPASLKRDHRLGISVLAARDGTARALAKMEREEDSCIGDS
jgi:hypothetical protein